jgi:bifunctional ADP-heptose synthase (sugar kinase/adenylyltransferase)
MAKIIVLGDAFIDRYVVGSSKRISPEAPIPVVEVEMTLDFPGGAANVRENLRSLGEEGLMLYKAINDPQNYPVKNRLMCGDTQIARWDERDWCEPFTRADLLPLLEADAIIVSDYGKGSVSKEVIQVLRETSLPLFVDTKGDPGGWIGSDAVMFPNLKEYKEFEEKYSWFPKVVLKCGSEGLKLLEYGKVVLSRPAKARFVKSVNGAGDTVLVAFVVALLGGCDLDYCLEFANAAAAIVVEKPFTASVTFEEVENRLYS